jgi:cAMP-dependent protein kinase regulator
MAKVSILSKCSSVEQSFFISKLRPVLFLSGDIIVREGEKGNQMFFLNKGEIQVILKQEKDGKTSEEVYRLLKDGAFFGEVALLTKLKRSATLKSTDFSNCAYLTRKDVILMERYFPHIIQ